MRTTLTIEPDVAQELERLRRASGRSLKRVVNDLLRAGLAERRRDERSAPAEPPTEPVSCGELRVPIERFESIGDLLAELDEGGT